MTLHSSLRHRRTCFWVAADSVPLGLIRAIFPGTLRDMLYRAHSKDNRSKNQRGGKKKRLKPHRPADLHSMSLMRFTSSEGGLSSGQKMLSMLTAMTLQSLITFDSAFYLASAVGTDAKSKNYQMNVALSVGMALLGKKPHINFIYICTVFLGITVRVGSSSLDANSSFASCTHFADPHWQWQTISEGPKT